MKAVSPRRRVDIRVWWKRIAAAAIAGALGLSPWTMGAANLPSGFTESPTFGTWDQFVGSTFDEIGTNYTWDRIGRVWVVEGDSVLPTPVLDISQEVGSWHDHGLLGLALHPNFRQNGYLYLLYVVDHHHLVKFGTSGYNPNSNEYNRATIGRLTRYTAQAATNFRTVDPASRTILLGETASTGIPILYFTHGIGSVVFGTDGTLLVSAGDGAALGDAGSYSESYYVNGLSEGIIQPKENVGSFRAQMVDSLSGKILRLDPATGNGVSSNPFYDAGNPRAARSRVWAVGFRNPFRISVKPGSGSLNPASGNPGIIMVGDVGQFTWEELDLVSGPGKNFGWPIYEGYSDSASYDGVDAYNQDAPNPLFGTGGCAQQYFSFRDLLKQATTATPSWPNPCNGTQQIPSSIPRFTHARPIMDWMHENGPSRVGIFNGTNATTINVGANGSPVSGPQFGGNSSVAGVWYQGTDFPATYQNTYFHADFGGNWIRNLVFDANYNLVSVRNFASDAVGVTSMATHPVTGGLYYMSFWTALFRVNSTSGGGNLPPNAVATSDGNYGPSPLAVQFQGSASTDPNGQALTYQWDFGDGSAISTQANPSHVFNTPTSAPTPYIVTLTVTDTLGASGSASLLISVNNTPPQVTILSPVNGTLYPMTGQTTYDLISEVIDAEHSQNEMAAAWQTVLHHDTHTHPEPIDPNWTSTVVISPAGCDGDTYFYRITLTITDDAGLSSSTFVDLFPDCTSNTAPTISDIPNQSTLEDTLAGPIAFSVQDAETSPETLLVSATSSNPTLLPSANIALGGSGGSRTITMAPTANQSGTATITVTVNDGAFSASDTFNLVVTAVNDPPTIANIADRSTLRNLSAGPIAFTIGDPETAAGNLTLTGASSNPGVVPSQNIKFGGSGANRTVTITPATNQIGSAMITITVRDPQAATAQDSFVLAVNDSPATFTATFINFQPSAAPVYPGYLADGGQVFGDRGNGLFYGWEINNTGSALDRNSIRSPDQRYDTLIQMQRNGGARTWQIAVPNGTYNVFVVAGDPSAYAASAYKIDVEGVLTVNGVPTSALRWISGSQTVTVNDGRLTVTNATGASKNKICFIDIVPVP